MRAETEIMRVWLLGGFRVLVGERTVRQDAWRLRKAASLVKLLALSPDHRLHREQAMETLWPELGARAASNNLRQTLYTARKALDPAAGIRYLASEDESLMLCPEGTLWVDVEAFEEAAATARRAREPAAYRAAIERYAGELLPGDRYEEWAEEHRRRLRETHLSLLLGLARLHEERGEYEPAIEALREVVAEEPHREEAHTGLMRLYALSGSKDEALAQYEHLQEALYRRLGTEPGATTHRLRDEIAAGEFPPPLPLLSGPPQDGLLDIGKHNLPAPRTSFVGREREMIEVKRTLAMTRLLTITGTGGSGKTRLAVEVARDLVSVYPDGVWLVKLAGLSEGEFVPQEVANTLGVREQPGHPLIETLTESLRTKTLLLVLDNCEHLLDDVIRLVDTLLDSCPGLTLLATSRETLGVSGEAVWRVTSLSVPDPNWPPGVENAPWFESVRLFVERVRNCQPAFRPTPQNVPAVAEICRRLEGIPLAIELAAARVGVLSVRQISERLGDSLGLLTSGNRATSSRQRTLRGALDWSYDLLNEPERKLFERLSVFAGGWTLEAAEAVGAGDGIERSEVLDLLSRLVDKSLIVVEADGNAEPRYRMLEPIVQYGRERLERSAESQIVRHRHAAWFLELAEKAEPELRGARQEAWLERLEHEHSNLRAALQWSLEHEAPGLALRLSGALGEFWHMRGHLSEGRRWLEAALENSEGSEQTARAKALARAGYIAWEQGDYEKSVELSEESLALSEKGGDAAGAAAALYTLGWAAMFGSELERASALIEEAVTLQRASGDTVGVARSLLILGFVANAWRDYERAMALHKESLALARKAGDGFAIVLSLGVGALAALGQGDYRQARALVSEVLRLSWNLKMMHLTAAGLHVAASLAGSQGQPVRSARLWGAAEVIRATIGAVLSPFERHLYAPYIAIAHDRLNEAAWEAAWNEGRAMPPEEAIEYALSEEKFASSVSPAREQPSAGARHPNLTRREKEVAALVTRGLTNRQIAEEIMISKYTVDNHIHNILKKLGLHSREQVAARLNEHR